METRPANSAPRLRHRDWNEIHYLDMAAFRKMAPAVIAVEIGKIERLVNESEKDLSARNEFVRVRFELERLRALLADPSKSVVAGELSSDLERVLLTLSVLQSPTAATREVLASAIDRLSYVYERLDFVES